MESTEGELELHLSSIHLSGEEAIPVVIQDPSSVGFDRMRSSCLLGKLLIDRDHDIRSLRAAFQQAWGCKFEFVRLKSNLYQIVFDLSKDADRIFMIGLWCFSNTLFCLQRWVEDWESRPNLFSSIEFWVHVVNLPYHFYTEAIGLQVVGALKSVGPWQLRTEQPSGQRLFRMRVPVDLRKPIRRFVTLLVNGTSVLGKLQYERLPHLCGQCGKWDHTVSVCRSVGRELTEDERWQLPYGVNQALNATRRSHLLQEFQSGGPHEQNGTNSHGTDSRGSGSHNSISNINRRSNDASSDSLRRNHTSSGLHNLNSLVNVGLSLNLVTRTIETTRMDSNAIHDIAKEQPSNRIASGHYTPNSEMTESAMALPLNPTAVEAGEDMVHGRDNGGYPQPISQLVVNSSSDAAPIVTESDTLESHTLSSVMASSSEHIRTVGGIGSNGDVVSNSLNNGEDVISHNHCESHQVGTLQPINQLVINIPSETTPMFTDLMRQFLRPTRHFNRQVQGQQSGGNNYSIGILQGSRGRSHRDIQMHNGARPEMATKRKATDVADGELSLKKSRISLSEPLVESSESQAHPAP